MRFIVDLYRFIILGFAGAILIAIALSVFLLVDAGGAGSAGVNWLIVAGVAAFLVLMILSIGVTAIIMSIHDRHVEISEELSRMANAADRIVATRLGDAQ